MPALPPELLSIINATSTYIINPLIGLVSVVALLLFIWGGMKFIQNAENPIERSVGQRHMLYGLIGLVIMLSVYAILRVGLTTFNVQSGSDYPSELPL